MSIRWPLRSTIVCLTSIPIPTGWSPSWRRAGKFSITAPPTAFTCAATSRFNARRGLPRRGTLMPMTSFLPLAVFLTATIRGTTSTAAASPTSTVCSLLTAWRASASWIIRPWSFASSGRTPRSSLASGHPLCVNYLCRICRPLNAGRPPEQLDRQPVGTGPFQLSDYRSGQYVRLQRHPGYWRGKPLMPGGGRPWLRRHRPPVETADRRMRRAGSPAASQLTILRDDPRLRLTLRRE